MKPNIEILKEPKGFIKGIELVSLRQDCALWRLIDNALIIPCTLQYWLQIATLKSALFYR